MRALPTRIVNGWTCHDPKRPGKPGKLGNISRSCKAIKPQVNVDAGYFPGCSNPDTEEVTGSIPVGASAGGMIA
jgi:hypothetical protein